VTWRASDEPTPGKSLASVHPTLPFSRDESGVDNFRIRSNPNPNYADVDNPNLIVCGCGLGYGVSDIRWIWIIR
jgi:hypothetical protein